MKLRFYIVFIFLIYSCFGFAQNPDSLRAGQPPFDEPLDSLPLVSDPSGDRAFVREGASSIRISPDALETNIDWGARDTMWFDRKNNQVHLYGSAWVTYESLKLRAGYIVFKFDDDEALAMPGLDSLGKENEMPQFEDGNQSFKAKKLRFNFRSGKGMVFDAVKQEGDLYVHGAKTKYISRKADTINHVETIYARDGIITSCNADHPHFGIRASKLKVVPNKLAVLGFSILEIADIPTPLMLPFGFYPMFKDQRSGIILPNNYTFNDNLGYGFTGIGVYFPINDYYDLKVLGDIYTRGSWGLHLTSNYKKRYKFNGNIDLSYFNARTEKVGSLDKNSSHKFSIRLSHTQDPKANPYQKFGGSISLTLNGYDQTFYTDAANRLNNITRSNFSYSNSLPGSIFSFNAGLEHSQNTQTGKISVTFPVSRLNMNTYFPFKSKSGGREQWYEKISIRYSADAKNLIEATDSTLFDASTLENARYGLRHSASSQANFSILKYLTVTPSVNYDETYFFKRRNIAFDPTLRFDTTGYDADGLPVIDTIFGQVVIDTINTFKPFRDFSSSISVSTKQYGKILFSKGWLRGIRHVVNYNVGFNYSPDTKQLYEVEIDKDGRDDVEQLQRYNIFVAGPYGTGNPSIKQMAIRYNISNNIEGKFYSRADSTTKKLNLIRSLNISGSYNFAADSLKFSRIGISASTNLFNNLISIRYSGSLDVYEENNNARINQTVWESRKRPFRHEQSSLQINSGFTIRQLTEVFTGKKKGAKNSPGPPNNPKQTGSLTDVFANFRINYDFGITWRQDDRQDTLFINRHVISTQGNIKLTPNWALRIGHIGYDFLGKSLTYPDLGFERNLHCWTMNFSWRPRAGQYTFFVGVRSATLDFLKYRHGQSPLETSLSGF